MPCKDDFHQIRSPDTGHLNTETLDLNHNTHKRRHTKGQNNDPGNPVDQRQLALADFMAKNGGCTAQQQPPGRWADKDADDHQTRCGILDGFADNPHPGKYAREKKDGHWIGKG